MFSAASITAASTGDNIFQIFKQRLIFLGLTSDNCQGQRFDNGSSMKGKHKGGQANI
jgi:hypothetical protein